jgi:hypothetical protein
VTALISLAAPFVFVILVVSQGLQYSDYGHSAMPISALAATESGPLHPWLGLLQRLTVLVWLQCMVAASWRAGRASTADVHDNEGTR